MTAAKFKSFRLPATAGLALLLASCQAFAQSWTATNIVENWNSLVLTADGSKIAAASLISGIYTSTNGGINWTNIGSPSPAPRSALACSTNGNILAAAYFGDGIYTSSDWGLDWLESSAPIAGWNCLASSWDGTRLAAGVSPGQIYTSKDSGATFTSRLPQNQGYQALAASTNGQDLVAAVLGGGIYRSVDAGETWAQLTAPSADWSAIASSASGANLAATIRGGAIYTSANAGLTWTPLSAPNNSGAAANGSWSALSSSSDGSQLVAVLNVTNYYRVNSSSNQAGALIYVSANYGANWMTTTSLAPAQLVSAIAGSADGTHLVAVAYGTNGSTNGGYIYYSTNSALTWVPSTNAPGANWSAVAASTDGSQVVAAVNGGPIYSSANSGQSWTIPTGLVRVSTNADEADPVWITNHVSSPVQDWAAIASSADGTRWVAAVKGGGIFTATNSGGVWQSNLAPWDVQNGDIPLTNNAVYESQGVVWSSNNVPAQIWSATYSSSDGNTLEAVSRAGWSYKSIDGGVTWTQLSAPFDFWRSLASSASGNSLLAASGSGFLWLSTNAGITWNQQVMPPFTGVPILATNIISSDTVSITVLGTNLDLGTTNFSITTNFFIGNLLTATNPAASDNLVFSNLLEANVFDGINVSTNTIGPEHVATNLVSGAGLFGMSLQGVVGVDLYAVSPFYQFTNSTGTFLTNSGPANLAGTNSLYANDLVFSVPVPYVSSLAISNSATLITTNLTTVLNVSTNGIGIFITNSLNIQFVYSVAPSWTSVAMSADGTHLAAAANFGLPNVPTNSAGYIYTSTNAGVIWQVARAPNTNWSSIAISADGSYLLAAVGANGLVYASTDSGNTWSVVTNLPSANWSTLAISANGADAIALAHDGVIYSQQNPVPFIQNVPALQIEMMNGNVVLTWIGGSSNLVVQQNANSMGTPWADLPATPVVTNGQSLVFLTNSAGVGFFRLKQP